MLVNRRLSHVLQTLGLLHTRKARPTAKETGLAGFLTHMLIPALAVILSAALGVPAAQADTTWTLANVPGLLIRLPNPRRRPAIPADDHRTHRARKKSARWADNAQEVVAAGTGYRDADGRSRKVIGYEYGGSSEAGAGARSTGTLLTSTSLRLPAH